MTTRPIKFRGRRANGQLVSGGILFKRGNPLIAVTHCLQYPVEPDSIAQLCGFDKNNNEVYEGDILLDELEQEHIAEIYDKPQFIKQLAKRIKVS